jgi:ubiquitin-activating enzyme E1 C
LDNIGTRRYINKKVHDLVEFDEDGNPDPSTAIPYIDEGTEGFDGQVQVIIPYKTSCYECVMKGIGENNNKSYPSCTIASNPRVPEHCIIYASEIE